MPGTSRPYLEPSTTALVSGDKLLVDSAARGTQGIDFDDLSTQFQLKSQRGAVSGYAELDSSGKVPAAQLRSAYTIETVADAAARNALTVTTPQIAVRQVRLADTGVIYVPNAAGTGSGIWEVFNSVGVASSSAEGIVMLADSADAETDDAKALTIAESLRRLGPYRNALAPAQALSCNGTAGSTLTLASALGSSDWTLCVVATPASVSVRQTLVGFTDGVRLEIGRTSGAASIVNTTGAGAVVLTGDATLVADVPVAITVRMASGTLSIKYNAVSAGSVAYAADFTGTSGFIGARDAGNNDPFTGTLRLLGIDTIALSDAEVLQLYRTGSWPSSHFNSASNTATYISNFSAGTDSWGTDSSRAVTGNVDSINGSNDWLKTEVTSGPASLYSYTAASFTPNVKKRLRVSVTIFNPTGSGITHFAIRQNDGTVATGSSVVVALAENTEVTTSVELLLSQASTRLSVAACGSDGTLNAIATGKIFYLKNFTVYPIGLLCAPDANQPGNGLTWGDRSGNGAHILLPTSGVDWLLPSASVNKLRGTTSTSGNQQLLGGTTLNANTQITRVRARSRSGTPSITLGTVSGGSQIVASVALSTTWKDLTIALTGGIISTASSVWVGSSTADVVEIDITHEPLSY